MIIIIIRRTYRGLSNESANMAWRYKLKLFATMMSLEVYCVFYKTRAHVNKTVCGKVFKILTLDTFEL